MKLYDFTQAPNPRRARMAIAEKGIDIEIIQIDLMKAEQLSDDFKKINPRCTVPVLMLEDGSTITENIAIAHYLEETHPEPPLFGKTPLERALVIEWNARAEQEGVAAVAEVFRNSVPGMASRAMTGPLNLEQIPALVERGTLRAQHFKTVLNERLADREFIAIDQFSIADITTFIFAEFAGRLKMPVTDEHPHLKRWFESTSARPSAKA